jgi:hypothetical protein
LSSIGWSDDKQEEGQVVAKEFGLDWNEVRERVEDYHRRLGIAPRSGRFRYISPTPLGVHLAVEAWRTFPEILRSLPDKLPSESAIDAYYDRLSTIASNPQARAFARDELSFFFRVDDLNNPRRIRIWAALAAADPILAASVVAKALSATSTEFRAEIKDRARRELVWTLERLAWKSACFPDAIRSLAMLAEAENETWANNATGEFIGKFQIYLGGTGVPFIQRLSILDALSDGKNAVLLTLSIKALAKAGDRNVSRTVTRPISDEVPEKEWRPASNEEYLDCVKACLVRLATISEMQVPETQSELVQAVSATSMMLRSTELNPLVSRFINAVRASYPETRESLRRIVSDLVLSEKKYWHELPAEHLALIESLRDSLEDHSLHARLQQFVGEQLWDQEHLPDLNPLAEELLADQEALKHEWPWLTSGEAGDAFRLGEFLAHADAGGTLADTLPQLPDAGQDYRVICGYVSSKQKELGNVWFDAWFESQYATTPRPVPLLFEVAWRCEPTPGTVRRIVEMLRSDDVSTQISGRLVYSRWHESLAVEIIVPLLRALADTGHENAAVVILEHRLKERPDEKAEWDELSLRLATCPQLIRSHGMASHSWKLVAEAVVPTHPSEVATAILNEQGGEAASHWFLEHERYALKVLDACLKVDPAGVWAALKNQLRSPNAYRFTIGFPKDLLTQIPTVDVMKWIKEEASERASLVARLVSFDFSSDESLASQILGAYGDEQGVQSAFFGEFISGGWHGSSASHWAELAQTLEDAASRTRLAKLRAWATTSAHSLRQMEERDRLEEEEEELRGR